MGNQSRYRAFISYSHTDQGWARRLHRMLETYRVPRHLVGTETDKGKVPARLAPIFRDTDDLPAATDLSDAVRDALARTDTLIVVCSPSAATSRWVNEEIVTFRQLNPDGVILTAIVGGEPFAEQAGLDPRLECFPPALLGDDDQALEPLAADFRGGGDSRRIALLKLVAGMLGIRLDQIIRRDLQRRQRRVTAITALSLSLTLVMGALTVFAFVAQSEAERRKAEAEDLIEFMLVDLREGLEPVGRLNVLDAVGEKIVEYYARQPSWQIGADELGRRSRAFHLLGRIAEDSGNLEAAERHFRAAYEATQRLLTVAPDSHDRMFEHSQSAYWVGHFNYANNDYSGTEPYWQEYLDLAQRLTELEPENEEYQTELGYALGNMGIVFFETGRYEQAQTVIEQELEIHISIAGAAEEGQVRPWISVADSYAWMADIANRVGDHERAIALRRQQVGVYEDQLAGYLTDWDVRPFALRAELGLGWTMVSPGPSASREDLEFGLGVLESLVTEMNAMAEHDPANVDWRITVIGHRNWLAHAYLLTGNVDAAQAALDAAVAMASDASLNADEMHLLQQSRTHSALIEARILVARGEYEIARTALNQILSRMLADGEWTENVAHRTYYFSAASNSLADAMEASGQAAEARETRAFMVTTLTPLEAILPASAKGELRHARSVLEPELATAGQ